MSCQSTPYDGRSALALRGKRRMSLQAATRLDLAFCSQQRSKHRYPCPGLFELNCAMAQLIEQQTTIQTGTRPPSARCTMEPGGQTITSNQRPQWLQWLQYFHYPSSGSPKESPNAIADTRPRQKYGPAWLKAERGFLRFLLFFYI